MPKLSSGEVAKALEVDCSESPFAAIDVKQLRRVARSVAGSAAAQQALPDSWSDPRFWNSYSPQSDRSQFFAIGCAVNFRFWRIDAGEVVRLGGRVRGDPYLGAMYMWRRLMVTLEEGQFPILEASFLRRLSEEQFDSVFADDDGDNPLREGGAERLQNLRNLGNVLARDWGGCFYDLVTEASGSIVQFSRVCQSIRAFDDPLYKLTMLNAILHSGSKVAAFDGHPIPAVDYHIVKQLARQGVLILGRDTEARLVERRILDPSEALGVRRTALCAMLQISEETGINGEILDNLWWWNRLKCRNDSPVCMDAQTASECPFVSDCKQRTNMGIPLEATRYY